MSGFGPLLWRGLESDPRVGGLLAAVHRADHEALERYALELIGWGRGATPAGDDLLAGLGTVYPWLARAVAPLARGRTTALGVELLDSVAMGAPPEPIADVVACRNASSLAQAARRLCAIGASSGTDALVGIYAAMASQ